MEPIQLDRYMEEMCRVMGMSPGRENPFGCGNYLEGDLEGTQGYFWYMIHEGHFAVTKCDFVFCRKTRFVMPSHMRFLSLRLDRAKYLPPGRLLAFLEERGRTASMVMEAGLRVAYTEVLYVPSFYERHLQTAFSSMTQNPIEILKSMGGSHNWSPEMFAALTDLYQSSLTGAARELFCVAKSYELMAALLAMGDGRLPKKVTDYEGILRVIRYLDQNYVRPCPQGDLARLSNMSATKLKRLFRQFTGSTITGYILNKKADHAARLLADTDLPIERIAAMVGFDTPTGFTTSFKKQMGIPPSEYRRQIPFSCASDISKLEP